MIITCPLCATRYQVPEASFQPSGRTVKCSHCAHTWFEAAPRPEPLGTGEAGAMENIPLRRHGGTDIETEAARLAAASRRASAGFARDRAARMVSLRGWAALVAVIAVTAAVGYFGRVEVVRVFPAAASLYAKIGLHVNIRGLEFSNVRFERAYENGVPILAVSGMVTNVSGEEMRLPRLRFGLLDASRQEVYHWTMAVSREPLAPNGGVNFSTRLAAPPEAAREVRIRFVKG